MAVSYDSILDELLHLASNLLHFKVKEGFAVRDITRASIESMTLTEFFTAVEKKFGVEITTEDFLGFATFEQVAHFLLNKLGGTYENP